MVTLAVTVLPSAVQRLPVGLIEMLFNVCNVIAVPLNSSAPISGVLTLRVSPSKSSVIPTTGVAVPSSNVGIAGLICKKLELDPVVLRKFGFSEKLSASLVGPTLVLNALIV